MLWTSGGRCQFSIMTYVRTFRDARTAEVVRRGNTKKIAFLVKSWTRIPRGGDWPFPPPLCMLCVRTYGYTVISVSCTDKRSVEVASCLKMIYGIQLRAFLSFVANNISVHNFFTSKSLKESQRFLLLAIKEFVTNCVTQGGDQYLKGHGLETKSCFHMKTFG